MVDIARQPILAQRLPWRVIGLGLVLLALLVALIAALAVGGRQRLPAPFGLARNGLIACASGGAIFAVDPETGKSAAIDKGPGDSNPRYSRDGTRLAFSRLVAGAGTSLVYVEGADGSGLIQVTPQPIPASERYTFSPDGKQIGGLLDDVVGLADSRFGQSPIRVCRVPVGGRQGSSTAS